MSFREHEDIDVALYWLQTQLDTLQVRIRLAGFPDRSALPWSWEGLYNNCRQLIQSLREQVNELTQRVAVLERQLRNHRLTVSGGGGEQMDLQALD